MNHEGEPPPRRLSRAPLARQLFLIIAVFSLGPALISNLLGYVRTRGYLSDAAQRDVRNVATLEAERTLAFVRERRRVTTSIVADNRHLATLVARLNESPAEAADTRSALRHHLAAKVEESHDVDELLVVDLTGNVRLSTVERSSDTTEAARRPCLEWSGQRAGVAGFSYGGEVPLLWVAVPIFSDDARRLGTFCAAWRFNVHEQMRLERYEGTTGGAIFLLDDTGEVVCGSFEDIREGPVEHEHGLPPDLARKVRDEGWRPWAGRANAPDGEPLLAAFAPVPTLSWGIVVAVPVHEALHGLERLKWQAIGVGAAVALVLVALIFVTSRRLTRRLATVAVAARRLAAGGLGERVPSGGPSEVAALASAFNQMSSALHDAHRTLEARIEARTRALRQSQEFTELLLDSVESWVVVVDRSGAVIKANAAAERLFGAEIVGQPHHFALEGLRRPRDDCPVRRTFDTGRPQRAERSQIVAGLQEIVNLETFPMFSDDGRVESVVEMGRVITAERERQAQMVHNEKMAAFGLLAAGMAHDIGNPLASIQSQLRVARENGDPRCAQETLRIVGREVDRIGRLLRDLVDFSRRRRDAVLLVSVNHLVEDVSRLLGHDPRASRVQIELRLAPDLPGVRTREDDLVQVLLNLGINALDAMSEGGVLVIDTSADERVVRLRVRDTGQGIPEAVRSRVFAPFFTTKAAGKGTGLGLFVSRGIVERLGGRLDLASSGADGTVFAIVLPIDGTSLDGDAT